MDHAVVDKKEERLAAIRREAAAYDVLKLPKREFVRNQVFLVEPGAAEPARLTTTTGSLSGKRVFIFRN